MRGALGGAVVRHRVAHHFTVFQVDDTRAVLVRELPVVGDHDDQPVARDLFEQLHDLHARLAVQRAGGFVREDDVGVVDQGARYRDALHLTARHLVRLFLRLLFQPDFAQRFQRPLSALLLGNACEGEAELHVFEHRHVGDEVVGLEDETYASVAVSVPILIAVFFGGHAVHLYVAVRITVQPAHDVEEGGLAAAGGSEDGNEFALAELDGNASQRENALLLRLVLLCDIDQFKHLSPFVSLFCAPTRARLIMMINAILLNYLKKSQALNAHCIILTDVARRNIPVPKRTAADRSADATVYCASEDIIRGGTLFYIFVTTK